MNLMQFQKESTYLTITNKIFTSFNNNNINSSSVRL